MLNIGPPTFRSHRAFDGVLLVKMWERRAGAVIPYSLSLDASQPMSFISIWFQGSIVPDLSFPLVIVDFLPTMGADDPSKFFCETS
jgi:hypothetical protein